ncbi:hypothetical protein KVV02_008140, partial [Mortierella alpina]
MSGTLPLPAQSRNASVTTAGSPATSITCALSPVQLTPSNAIPAKELDMFKQTVPPSESRAAQEVDATTVAC